VHWDWDAWWIERAFDLRRMTLERFCEKHGCSMGAASQRRQEAVLGKSGKGLGLPPQLQQGAQMTGKHYNWHRAWRWQDGRLVHDSGAAFAVAQAGDGTVDISAAPETLGAFKESELARGVPLHDLQQRLTRLAREAGEFAARNPQP
jgi:hypothetical protein